MKKIKRVQRLASEISPWLYSDESPPKELNKMFIAWVDYGKIPSWKKLKKVIHMENVFEVFGKY